MDPGRVVATLDAELRATGTAARAEQERRYLKSDLQHYGTSVPAVRRIVRSSVPRDISHRQLVGLVKVLWREPIHERRMAAVELCESRVGLLGPADLPLLERLVRESRTWALVDGLAASVVGPLLERHPEVADEVLDRWATDDDFWIRRSALLAHLVALREGRGDFERFGRYADAMLGETEFFVRKAIGWILRDTARKRPEMVAAWLLPRAHRASGLTVREAVKRLPPADAERILAAHRCGA